MKAAFNIKLQGFPQANRDAMITIKQQATGAEVVKERKPFLDGSLTVRDLDPGLYEVEVRHPNLTTPIDRRVVRLFPTPVPTQVFVPVPADLFRDTPIRDIPDVDLGPVQQAATAARNALQPIAGKSPGEAIRAADWNTLAGAVSDLAGAVLQLAGLVSPQGHNHPEIEEKIGEVQENLRRFAEAYGRSLLELRRELETENLRQQVTDVLDQGGASADLRTRVLDRVAELERTTQSDTPNFTRKLATTGTLLLNAVNEIAVARGAEGETFLQSEAVQKLSGMARQYSEAGTQVKPESELQTYQRTTTTAGSKVQIFRR
jgi:hypothetical protein